MKNNVCDIKRYRNMHSGQGDTVPLAYQLMANNPLVLSSQALEEKARKLGYSSWIPLCTNGIVLL